MLFKEVFTNINVIKQTNNLITLRFRTMISSGGGKEWYMIR